MRAMRNAEVSRAASSQVLDGGGIMRGGGTLRASLKFSTVGSIRRDPLGAISGIAPQLLAMTGQPQAAASAIGRQYPSERAAVTKASAAE